MEVILDSNFIISCLRRKIDFLSELRLLGLTPMLPREVLQELKDLKMKLKHDDRAAINMALTLFEEDGIKKMKLGNRTVDLGLIDKGKKGIYIATLDSAIKRMVPNKVLISDSQNKLIVERD